MIDWQRVHELQDEVGLEDFHEVVDLFLEEVEEVVERLKGTPDPASYEADFHFLKGSALNLGFQAFATICADNERSAAAGKPDDVDVDGALASYAESRSLFLSKLEADQAA